jgi:hypothetical protein
MSSAQFAVEFDMHCTLPCQKASEIGVELLQFYKRNSMISQLRSSCGSTGNGQLLLAANLSRGHCQPRHASIKLVVCGGGASEGLGQVRTKHGVESTGLIRPGLAGWADVFFTSHSGSQPRSRFPGSESAAVLGRMRTKLAGPSHPASMSIGLQIRVRLGSAEAPACTRQGASP